jgi:hypothetical protein
MRRTTQSALDVLARLAMVIAAAAGFLTQHAASADLFATEEPLAISLAAPFADVFRAREDPQYQEAKLTYRDAAGSEVAVPLRLRVRGKSRAAMCGFPPLLLNFRTRELVGTVLEGEDRLKLVTHCESNDSYDQYLRLEYLSYRVWNLVSPTSLRARWVAADYVDTRRERALGMRPAILLEDEQRFAERHGLTIFEGPAIERAQYDAESLALLDVFQYFLGNTDWSALAGPSGEECCHNVVPYVRPDGVMVPVPYDFDAAGLVDAPHALPNERLPIRDVRQRLYRGACRTPDALAPTFARFQSERSAILALFGDQPGLDEKTAQGARRYVEAFYETLDDPKLRESAFFGVCRR